MLPVNATVSTPRGLSSTVTAKSEGTGHRTVSVVSSGSSKFSVTRRPVTLPEAYAGGCRSIMATWRLSKSATALPSPSCSGLVSGVSYDTLRRAFWSTPADSVTSTSAPRTLAVPVPRISFVVSVFGSETCTRNALPAGSDAPSSASSKVSRSVVCPWSDPRATTSARSSTGRPSVPLSTGWSAKCGTAAPAASSSGSSVSSG